MYVLSLFNSVIENVEEIGGDQEMVVVGGRMSSSNLSAGVVFHDMQTASSFSTVNSQ
jgi:methylmalonyl-CoA mutase cobalamin-binding subunit